MHLPLDVESNLLKKAIGHIQTKAVIQIRIIDRYACLRVCQLLDRNGSQIAKYLSMLIATRVHADTATDVANGGKRI